VHAYLTAAKSPGCKGLATIPIAMLAANSRAACSISTLGVMHVLAAHGDGSTRAMNHGIGVGGHRLVAQDRHRSIAHLKEYLSRRY
jgi:hypothetical protein